jgi:uncharacterized phage protein gp47/JayE
MASINPNTGYLLKTQNEWFEEERQLYLDIDSNWNLDPSTPDGLKMASDAETFANLDETLQNAYNSKDPAKATSSDLDAICAITDTRRSLGTPSQVAVTLGGVAGTIVVSGKTIKSSADGTTWTIDTTSTIGVGGTVDTTATCTVNGSTAASIGTITKIVDVVGGWQTVTNTAVATLGTNVQSDPSLRLERRLSVGRPGNYQLDSMRAEIYTVDGVRRVLVLDNAEDTTDSNGVPAHNTYVIVDGGTDEKVAMAIYNRKGTGSPLYQAGTPVSVPIASPTYSTNVTNIKFSRPIYDDMIVAVTVENGDSLPDNAETAIAQAIVDYANGESDINTSSGFNLLGFNIAENVAPSRLFTPVNQYIGRYGNAYCSGVTIDGSAAIRTIAFNALSRWSVDNITVVINDA